MAGSYSQILDEDGGLLEGGPILDNLNHDDDDIVECITQLYGMIWYLAEQCIPLGITKDVWARRAENVKIAQDDYAMGLKWSPTERFQPFDERQYEGVPIADILFDWDMADAEHRDFITMVVENRIKKAKGDES